MVQSPSLPLDLLQERSFRFCRTLLAPVPRERKSFQGPTFHCYSGLLLNGFDSRLAEDLQS